MKNTFRYLVLIFFLGIISCTKVTQQEGALKKAAIFSAYVNGVQMTTVKAVEGVPVDGVVFELEFSTEIDSEKFDPSLIVFSGGPLHVSPGRNDRTLRLEPVDALKPSLLILLMSWLSTSWG